MTVFLLTFSLMALALLGLGLGVLFGRPAIKGSCGGGDTLNGIEGGCALCTRPCERQKPFTHAS